MTRDELVEACAESAYEDARNEESWAGHPAWDEAPHTTKDDWRKTTRAVLVRVADEADARAEVVREKTWSEYVDAAEELRRFAAELRGTEAQR